MKKKFYVGFAAAALAGVMCVSLTACGKSVDAESIKGEEVTEEQWAEAISLLTDTTSQYTIEATAEEYVEASMSGVSGGYELELSMSYVKNGNLEYAKATGSFDAQGVYEEYGYYEDMDLDAEMYGEYAEDGTYYLYEQDEDGNWTKTSAYDSALDEVWDYGVSYDFGLYTYDEEYKGYVRAMTSSVSEDDCIVLKFQDGKLVAIFMYYYSSGDISGASYTTETEINFVITYEEKEVTLPTVA